MPLALRCVGPARRGAVLYGSASNLSPVVGPARRGTACGTTSGGALEPGCRRTAHCRQRRFAASTAVSLILLRAESRRMGETAVDVAKVRSRSPRSSDARPRSAEVSTCPVELVRTPRSRAPEYDGGIPGGGSIWCHALPSARVRRSSPRRASTIPRRHVQKRTELPELHCVLISEPHGTKRVSDPDPHSPAPCRSGTGLRCATTPPGNSARSRSAA